MPKKLKTPNVPVIFETHPELIEARHNWQKALQDKQLAMSQWETYVSDLEHKYLELKIKITRDKYVQTN